MTSRRSLSLVLVVSAGLWLAGCSSDPSPDVNGADPGVLEAPIAFVKRPIPVDEDGDERQPDVRDPTFFMAGGDVYIRSNSTITASEINITAAVTGGQGDVKDLMPSFDGNKLLFSLRLFDENENDDEVPSWNIYEYDLETRILRRVIGSDFTAEEGDDLAPAYLPDGRIVFSSNRQVDARKMLLDEGKPPFKAMTERGRIQAFTLHVMDEDGQNIQQLSFNQSHDLYPTVLSSLWPGEILYTRWDHAGGNDAMNLYKMKPDGSDLEPVFGVHDHDFGRTLDGSNDQRVQLLRPLEMEDGRILVQTRDYAGSYGGGDLMVIDVGSFTDNGKPVYSMSSLSGPAAQAATIDPVTTEPDTLSPAGRYSAAWPLWDGSNRLLVSKSSCKLAIGAANDPNVTPELRPCIEPWLSDPEARELSPEYSIWLYDMNSHAQKIIVRAEPGQVVTDIVALQSRPRPSIVTDQLPNEGWASETLGALHIRSVYDLGTGSFDTDYFGQTIGAASIESLRDPAQSTAAARPARFVRFVKAVALPDDDDPDLENPPDLDRAAFGPQRNQGMREIVGYAPVAPDGSVKVKLPANVPLAVSVLDQYGRRISPRHENWFQVRPGQTTECTGCHAESGNAPPPAHARKDAEAPSINPGAPVDNVFPNTLNPDTGEAYFADAGKTMAESRFALAGKEPEVSANVVFDDVWTDPAVRTPDASIAYEYDNLDVALKVPTIGRCLPDSSRDFTCRIQINYPTHIHPLWSLPRGVNGADTCTNCHTSQDDMGNDRVPDGQLDLSDGVSDQEPDHLKSYEELFRADAGQELDMNGTLVNIQIEQQVPVDADGDGVQDVDENGDPIFDTIVIDDPDRAVNPTMSGAGAMASFFVNKMLFADAHRDSWYAPAANHVDHSGFMTPDELRLVIEWLDIGAQYFNDPFDPDAPSN
jgi:hypothetical protein